MAERRSTPVPGDLEPTPARVTLGPDMDATLRSWLEGQGFKPRPATAPLDVPIGAVLTAGQKVVAVAKPVGVVLALVFAAGGAWVALAAANTTDDELDAAIIEHSAEPHPATAEQLDALSGDVEAIRGDMKAVRDDVEKAATRGEYQFHFSRWQAAVIECERSSRCRRPPKKPAKVSELEAELMTK